MLALICFMLPLVYAIATPVPPVLTLQNLASNLTGHPHDRYLFCNETFGQHILASDCESAVDMLPRDQPGDVYYDGIEERYIYPIFSRHRSEPRHQLPATRASGSCGVEIRLAERYYGDRSSWRILALRIGNLIKRCVNVNQGIGGSVITGEERGIEIVVVSRSVPRSVEE